MARGSAMNPGPVPASPTENAQDVLHDRSVQSWALPHARTCTQAQTDAAWNERRAPLRMPDSRGSSLHQQRPPPHDQRPMRAHAGKH